MREYQWRGGARVAAFFILLAILFIITETKAMAAGPTDSIRTLFGEVSRIVNNPARQGSFTCQYIQTKISCDNVRII